jgi:hypothetical protein
MQTTAALLTITACVLHDTVCTTPLLQQAIDDFLKQGNLSYIVRAHEAHSEGVSLSKGAKVFTVFSTSKVTCRHLLQYLPGPSDRWDAVPVHIYMTLYMCSDSGHAVQSNTHWAAITVNQVTC